MSPTAKARRTRDILIRTALALAAIAVVIGVVNSHFIVENRANYLDQRQGRQVAFIANCAIIKASIDAGRAAIQGTGLLEGDKIVHRGDEDVFVPGPLTKQLGPNFPSYPERLAAGKAAADSYESAIIGAVKRETRENGTPISPVGKDGHLDCDVYARQVKVKPGGAALRSVPPGESGSHLGPNPIYVPKWLMGAWRGVFILWAVALMGAMLTFIRADDQPLSRRLFMAGGMVWSAQFVLVNIERFERQVYWEGLPMDTVALLIVGVAMGVWVRGRRSANGSAPQQ